MVPAGIPPGMVDVFVSVAFAAKEAFMESVHCRSSLMRPATCCRMASSEIPMVSVGRGI
jgi:hypothetical protein